MLHNFTLTALTRAAVKGTRAEIDNRTAHARSNPLLVAMDALLRMAHHNVTERGNPISEDYYARQEWLDAATSIRALVNMDFGPIDNGTVEVVFWEAMRVAGFTEGDM